MSRKQHTFIIALAVVVAVGVTASLGSAAGKGKARPSDQLAGTWQTTITLLSPPPGLEPTFQALDTFSPGGGLVVSSSQANPGLRSLAHGEWARVGSRKFVSTFVWFRHNDAGAYIGLQRVRRTMELTPDLRTFQATDVVEILAPNGTTVVASLQATEAGHRLSAS